MLRSGARSYFFTDLATFNSRALILSPALSAAI